MRPFLCNKAKALDPIVRQSWQSFLACCAFVRSLRDAAQESDLKIKLFLDYFSINEHTMAPRKDHYENLA